MQAGDILLFRPSSLVSKLISWGTSSPYAHVAICVNSGMHLVIEAQERVQASDIRRLKDYDVFRVKEEYSYNLDKVVSFLVSKLGNNYDYIGVIYLGFLKVLSKIGLPTKKRANKWQKDNDYFCTELSYDAFNYGGLKIVNKLEGSVVSAADIAESDVIEKV